MALSQADQVTYATGLTVTTNGSTATYPDGAVLPTATIPADLAARVMLRAGGVTRLVTVATTAGDFTTAVLAEADAAAAEDAAAGDQSPPVVEGDAGPVVASYGGA